MPIKPIILNYNPTTDEFGRTIKREYSIPTFTETSGYYVIVDQNDPKQEILALAKFKMDVFRKGYIELLDLDVKSHCRSEVGYRASALFSMPAEQSLIPYQWYFGERLLVALLLNAKKTKSGLSFIPLPKGLGDSIPFYKKALSANIKNFPQAICDTKEANIFIPPYIIQQNFLPRSHDCVVYYQPRITEYFKRS